MVRLSTVVHPPVLTFRQPAAGGLVYVSEYELYNTTTDGSQTELFTDGASARVSVGTDKTLAWIARVIGRRTDTPGEDAHYRLEGTIKNNSGTTSMTGNLNKFVIQESSAAWDVTIEADDTNDAFNVLVTGEAGKTIKWVCYLVTVEASV